MNQMPAIEVDVNVYFVESDTALMTTRMTASLVNDGQDSNDDLPGTFVPTSTASINAGLIRQYA